MPNLYPERPGSREFSLEYEPVIELSEEEREGVLAFEGELYAGKLPAQSYEQTAEYLDEHEVRPLEEIWRMTAADDTPEFGLEYFTTPIGREALTEVTDEEVNIQSEQDAKAVLAAIDWHNVPKSTMHELSGDSKDHTKTRVADEFEQNGFATMEGIREPDFATIVRDPEMSLDKLKALRDYKGYLKTVNRDIETHEATDSGFAKAQQLVTDLYRRTTNELIAAEVTTFYVILDQLQAHDSSRLREIVNDMQEQLPVNDYRHIYNDPELAARALERYDQFRNGVSYRNSQRSVISEPAYELANTLTSNYPEERYEPIQNYYFADVEQEQLDGIKVQSEELQEWAGVVLERYGLLSQESDKDLERTTKPADGKWQVVVTDQTKSLSVDNKRNFVKVPREFDRTIADAVGVLSHEIAHVVQGENQRKADLNLSHEIGTDRGVVQTEAGGIHWERLARRQLFGKDRPVNPHYLRAIEAKSNNGDYLQAAQAYFESSMKQNPSADSKKKAKTALASTRRIFRYGGNWAGESYVTNSQPLQYLEQSLVTEQLDADQEQLLLAGRFNMQTVQELVDVGLMDPEGIWVPEEKPWEILLPLLEGNIYGAVKPEADSE